MKAKVNATIIGELEKTGLEWEIIKGGRHRHIRINGDLVGILPKASNREPLARDIKNTIAQIRRYVRGTGAT